ncbi:MAG TPA: TetR/AcrR family transcriptional regulator [Pseudosphingobacterium sp.]|nr:TetR/AcrR family transcriptional regulator [Pseudosphingobacterium sp.]
MKKPGANRREKIMNAALLLFSAKGYADTSTKLIAKEANVSEALIFKHFENKDKLLFHLIKSGYRRVLAQNKGMLTYSDPSSFLKNMIDLPRKLVSEEPLFWRLQERLSHHDFSKQQHYHFMKPVNTIINKAFTELGMLNPDLETQFLLLIIDTMWKKEAVGDLENITELAELIKAKYNLQ